MQKNTINKIIKILILITGIGMVFILLFQNNKITTQKDLIDIFANQNIKLKEKSLIYEDSLQKSAFLRDSLETIIIVKNNEIIDNKRNILFYKGQYKTIKDKYKQITSEEVEIKMVSISNIIVNRLDTFINIPKKTGIYFLEVNDSLKLANNIVSSQDSIINEQTSIINTKNLQINQYKKDSLNYLNIKENFKQQLQNDSTIITIYKKENRQLKTQKILLIGLVIIEAVGLILRL